MAKNTEKVNAIGLFSNMKPVNQSAENKRKQNKEEISLKNKNISVDKKEDESNLQKEETSPIQDEASEKISIARDPEPSEAISRATVEFYIQKKRERKKIHKSFTVSESINNKFVDLARQSNMSENELLNTILEQVFQDYVIRNDQNSQYD